MSCSSGDDTSELIIENDETEIVIQEPFKKIVSDNYNSDTFIFGATLNYYQLNTNVEQLFLDEFNKDSK